MNCPKKEPTQLAPDSVFLGLRSQTKEIFDSCLVRLGNLGGGDSVVTSLLFVTIQFLDKFVMNCTG